MPLVLQSDPRHSDVNPYEEAEDGAPGTIRTSIDDDDSVNHRNLTKTTTLTGSEEGREGDYSQVDMDGACSLANPLVSGVCGLVSHHYKQHCLGIRLTVTRHHRCF